MNFTKENYDSIVSIQDTDEAFDNFMDVFENYTKEFQNLPNDYFQNEEKISQFRESSKNIFKSLKHCITMSEEDKNLLDYKELEKYNTVLTNVDIIIDKVDNTDLNDKESELFKALNIVFSHFEMMNNDMKALNDSISDTCDSLEELAITLEIKNITEEFKNYTLDQCKIKIDWCEDTILKYDEDIVNQVKDNLNSDSIVDYTKESENSTDEQKYNKLINAQNLTLILNSLKLNFDLLMIKSLSDKVKNNTFDIEKLPEEIKWCKSKLAKYQKDDVIKVFADYTNKNSEDYKEIIMNALENNDTEIRKKYAIYTEIYNILNVMMMLELKFQNK